MRSALATRRLPLAFAVAGGLVFIASLVYFAIAYVWRFDAPVRAGAPVAPPAIADAILFTVFALHHSVFARSGMKRWIQRVVPPDLERSTYVWIASVLFLGVCVAWQPVPGQLWNADGGARAALLSGQALAGVFTLVAARRLDVLDLAGIRQVRHAVPRPHTLDDTGPYALVRHPIYLAWIALVWLAPTMNGTRLVFAGLSTAYLLAAIPFEERDLRRTFGAAYSRYSERVRWRVLPFVY